MRTTIGLKLTSVLCLLASTDVCRADLVFDWTNRATAGFTMQEEAVIDAACNLWKTALPFSTSRTISLDISRAPLGGAFADSSNFTFEPLDNPTGGKIVIDSATPFFVDPTPLDHSEFTPSGHPAHYTAVSGGAVGAWDLLTTVTHEIGHVIGFTAEHDRFASRLHPVTPQLFVGETFSVPMSADNAHIVDDYDLMGDPGFQISERALPSPTNLAMLKDTFDYTGKQTISYTGSPVALADDATTQIQLPITAPGTFTDVDVALHITHTYVSDLELALISPTGTRVVLSLHNGGSDEDYGSATWWTRFDDESILYPVGDYGGYFPGSYQPDGSLAAMDGQPLAGTWILEVIDDFPDDTGTLLGWSLIFTTPDAAQPGDFDGDGDVDGADFVAWQTHFPLAEGATRADGDADGDGDVDGADFVVWQTNFPFPFGPGIVPVPEPAAGILFLIALGGMRYRLRSVS